MNIKLVAEKTFNLLKGFGFEVSSYNKEGDLVIDPMEATRFACESPNILVRIDPNDKHLSLKTGTPGEAIEKIRPMLKELAQDYLLDFDYSVFDKQIKPKGEKVDVAKKSKEEMQMSEDMNILKKLAGLEVDQVSENPEQQELDLDGTDAILKVLKVKVGSFMPDFKAQFLKAWRAEQAKPTVPAEGPSVTAAALQVLQTFNNARMLQMKQDTIDPAFTTDVPSDYEDGRPGVNRESLEQDLDEAIELAISLSEKQSVTEAGTKTVNGCTVYTDGSPLSFADWRKETEMETGSPMKRSAEDQKMDYQSYVNRCKSGSNISEASLGKMTGSRKSSYQPLADSVKIIVRHNKDVNEEVRGARSRNIHSILIQRGEEKFKMAENNLSAARAMARHLHNGGETFDEIGEAITDMSKEFGKLKEFVSYVRKANLVNETNEEFVSLAMENINNIKTTFKRLSGVKSYANAVESVINYNNVELLQDDLDLESKFTETHFDDKVANVMDSLKAMTSRRNSFESKITKAIELESFAGVKDMLAEDDLMEFETLNQQLGHKVSSLGNSAKDETLSNYLHGISSKLNAGGQLNQFEYGAVKSCLLSAGQHNVQSAPMTASESYEAFMDRFVD
tara:strand:- start:1739 stop:3601 length:1863 start_codon:yes stop_codon:yes gene_type:complete